MSDLGQVEEAVKKAVDEYGVVDILVNNVGWDIPMAFLDTTPEFWEKIIAINYRSVLNFVKTILPHMIEQKKAGGQFGLQF